MSCNKKTKANCKSPDCEWIVGKGCKKLVNVPSPSVVPMILSKAYVTKKCKVYKITKVDDDVVLQFNELFDKICKKAFKGKQTLTINVIDENLKLKLLRNEIADLFIQNGESSIIKNLRNVKQDIGWDIESFIVQIKEAYNVEFDNIVGYYLSGALDYIYLEIIEKTKAEVSNLKTLTIDIILQAINSDDELEKFFDNINFEFKSSKPNVSESEVLDTERLPKIWEVESTLKKFYKKMEKRLIPGDILYISGSEPMMIMRDGKMKEVIENDSRDKIVPPWVGEFYMLKGYKFSDIVNTYSDSICRYFLYPFNNPKQKKALKIEDGLVVKIIGYDMYDKEDVNEEFMGFENFSDDVLKKENLFM